MCNTVCKFTAKYIYIYIWPSLAYLVYSLPMCKVNRCRSRDVRKDCSNNKLSTSSASGLTIIIGCKCEVKVTVEGGPYMGRVDPVSARAGDIRPSYKRVQL